MNLFVMKAFVYSKRNALFLISICTLLLTAGACTNTPAQSGTPTIDPTQMFEHALLTATYAIVIPSKTPQPVTPSPTATALPPTPDPNRTPPALPGAFQTDQIMPGASPHTYINNVCQYLKDRWNPNNSQPGTVVMPIMFHSITDGNVVENNQVTHDQVEALLRDLKSQGFQSITTTQLANFLEHNALIPPRSVILIVDDRHYAAYFQTHFLPFLQANHWTVTNAWISTPVSTQDLIDGMAALIKAGWVDVQAHGVIHNTPIDGTSSEDYIHSELFGSISFIQQHFGKTPIAYIWPGGGFTPHAATVARQAGYQMGFTVNPRGPIMYNWVPLGDSVDLRYPSYIPEGPVNDPLMVLPRYWDTDAFSHIDEVRTMGKQAAAYASQNKATELEYYDIVCKSITGLIPTAQP
ncbi:MAG: polysaccharide deacetylase family protein [Anaerolineaceae bacterium]|nr:polysaccharide deacetylase family protein [Anaerolineaceae bacterium]